MKKNGADPGKSNDINLQTLHSLAHYLRDQFGQPAVEDFARAGGLTALEVESGKHWISLASFEAALNRAFELLDRDEERFRLAISYKLAESYGLFRYVFRAVRPKTVLTQAMKTVYLVSSIGTYEIIDARSTWIRARYRSTRAEGRLSCLLRQANAMAMPTFWGLAPARVTDTKCIGRGDDCCEYEAHWAETWRLLPIVLGAATGFGCAQAAALYALTGPALWLALPLLGAAVAQLYEMRRVHRANLEFADETYRALEQLAREGTEAHQEVVALHQRERAWTHVLESEIADRVAKHEEVVSRLRQLQEQRVTSLRSFSHDLNNPLAVVHGTAEALHERVQDLPPDLQDVVSEQFTALNRMEAMLKDLVLSAIDEGSSLRLITRRLEVAPLVDVLRRRLSAMAFGRDIRNSVISTREAPEAIEIDPMLFDRVIDNLLTNAVKYTERGSIVVEIGGTPGFLALKVSDTGRGIGAEQIVRVFEPAASDEKTRAERSFGLGLSAVVRLLDEVGGKLEVMSKPNSGTTFWVYFPTEMSRRERSNDQADDAVVGRVVTIRRANAS